LAEGLAMLDVLGYSGIRLWSTSESGPVGASRSPSDTCIRLLSVFGVYSVSWVDWSILVA